MNVRVLMAAVLALFVLAGTHAQEAKPDAELIQGTWKIVSGERRGKKLGADELKTMQIIFKGDEAVLKEGDKQSKATFKLDPEKNPKTIDLMVKDGDKTETIPGIYSLAGDELKICAAGQPGKERPTEFTGKEGTGLFVLKRDKP